MDTIAAISTALDQGAISIVRMSGEDAIAIADTLCTCSLHDAPSHTIHYGYIKDPQSEEVLDEVLISVFRAPKTFTREDMVEINCHGGIYITRKILRLLLANGARLATRGEFTQRAFLNGRIDLTQAEAINDMIAAEGASEAKLAVQGIRGSIKKLLDPFLEELLDIIAHIEVNIDYPEYDDVEQLTNEVLLPKARDWAQKINAILARANSGKIVKEGISTAIVGQANVGKSSLLNALLEEEKAIVTDIAGTTRDIVEGSIHLGAFTLHLIDTAGIRETQDTVEKIGIARSLKAIEEAQLVIVVLDGSKEADQQDQELLEKTADKNRIIVYNKKDISQAPSKEGIWISAANGEIDALIKEIHRRYDEHLIVLKEPSLANDRQIALMMKAQQAMTQAITAMEAGMELDLVAIDIQEAYSALKEILGEVHREDLLDALFSNFCLGK
ncbi:tRNA uridine-5-carboxymethylaminomethyl(34) synthesis GTPase MnmE [Massilicoli timonensis]|uniref:tRNA uridine-5-carboxymethylaminomethyl(34) synthesis GTPase MnmE n=1 Tax=Massilicoli timonensis TaxID=2015901 RepID=UPI000C83CF47|nr:tRNA uridine-5-carboxymethylaminomethyl(34) synthesis GTPase MnmE [Massilicoli timonensis]